MGKVGKGSWSFSIEEGEKESLGDEGSTESEKSFSLSSSLSEGDSEGIQLSESLGAPSVASPGSLDEPVSGGEEEEEEF